MLLTVGDDPIELEGTQAVVCQTSGNGLGQATGHVLLRYESRSCGALLARSEEGADSILLDKFLRAHLQVCAGQRVEVEFREFPGARSIQLVVPPERCQPDLTDLIRDSLIGKPLCSGQVVPIFMAPLTGEYQVGELGVTDPDGVVVVRRDTHLTLESGRVATVGVSYRNIGGLSREIEQIREIVEFPFRHPGVFGSLGIAPPRGLILYGPPGTGKTLIAKALAHEVGAAVLTIRGPEIMSGWYGGSEHNIRAVFDEARDRAPSIILIDELDSIAGRRDRTHGEVERRVVATLLTLMDGLADLDRVAVIGTTNSIDSIDVALRRPGRFEHEIHIGVPDLPGREEILAIHTRRMPLAGDVQLSSLAESCHGFVGADLAALCRQAAYHALRRLHSAHIADLDTIPDLTALVITGQDFENARKSVRPSAMREVVVQAPQDVSWESVGGLESVKQLLIENVVHGISNRRSFEAAGIKPAHGVLLHGPPGTGKTLLARVIARESGANFIAIRGPEVKSKWFGESEERLRHLFAKARDVAPCVVLIDELDSIAAVRGGDHNRVTDSIVNQLLTEMDGLDSNDDVFVIGTTNQLSLIDPGVLRPGRFDYQVLVPVPDSQAREDIYKVHLRGKPDSSEVDVAKLSANSDGLSGADIAEVCRLATIDALRANEFLVDRVRLTTESFLASIENVKQTQHRLREVGF